MAAAPKPDPDEGTPAESESIAQQAANKLQQEPIPGFAEAMSLDAGGEAVTKSSIKLVGGALPLEGQFSKGDVVRLQLEIRVGEVSFVDTVDVNQNVTGTERKHVARVTSVRRMPQKV